MMFSKAKVREVSKKPTRKTKKNIHIEGMQSLAAIDAVIKSLSELRDVYDEQVKKGTTNVFLAEGIAKGAKPDNFIAVDDGAEGSAELRKRLASSGLSPAEILRLTAHGISVSKTEKPVKTYIVNPKYKDDSDLLSKIEQKLRFVSGIPKDFIQIQDSVKKVTTTDESLDQLFATKNASIVRELLPIVGTLTVRPMLDDDVDAFALVNELLKNEKKKE